MLGDQSMVSREAVLELCARVQWGILKEHAMLRRLARQFEQFQCTTDFRLGTRGLRTIYGITKAAVHMGLKREGPARDGVTR
jgi:hypothetical protein